jgi:hypothetical protein
VFAGARWWSRGARPARGRLDEINTDLKLAETKGWRGELEGIDPNPSDSSTINASRHND